MPSHEFDTSDPLGALMAEWRNAHMIFWIGVAGAGVLTMTAYAKLAWLLGLVVLGMLLVLLGQSVVICANELRKTGRTAPQRPDDAR